MCNFYYSYPTLNYYISKSYKNILYNIIKDKKEEDMTKTNYPHNTTNNVNSNVNAHRNENVSNNCKNIINSPSSHSNNTSNGNNNGNENDNNYSYKYKNKNRMRNNSIDTNKIRNYHSSSDGSMLEYVYDLEDMNRRFSDYQDRLGQLALLYEYDKIGFHEDKIYADRKSSFQFFRRWYYGQNREVTYINLKNLFDDYYIYINMVKSSLNMNNAESYVILGRAVHSFNYSLISGLDKLKKTYENEDEKLVLLIADIINNLRMLNSQISNTRIFTAFYPTPTSPSLTSTAPSKNNNGSAPSSPASTKL
jgi:hypothetical protein